jgi:hypothetical protein
MNRRRFQLAKDLDDEIIYEGESSSSSDGEAGSASPDKPIRVYMELDV